MSGVPSWRLSRLIALGFVAILTAACVTPATPSPSVVPPSGSAGSTAATNSRPIEIRIWDPHGPTFAGIAKAAITDYQTAHPNVTIKIEPVDNPVYLQRILTAAAAGTLPDIIYANAGTVSSMISSNTVFSPMPADQFKDQLSMTVAGFNKMFQDSSGTQVMLPIYGGYHGWDYLVGDLQKVGYSEFPKTWSQLMDACQKLVVRNAKGDITREGISWRFRTYGPRVEFQGFLGVQGVALLDANKKVNIDTPAGLNALTLMHDSVWKYNCSLPLSKKTVPPPGVLPMTLGLAAMEFEFPGSDVISITYGKDHPEYASNWNKTPLWPRPDSGGQDYVVVGGDAFGVAKSSPNASTAWDFLAFLSQPKYLAQLATFSTMARKDVMQDASVVKFFGQDPNAKNILDLFTKPDIAALSVPDMTDVHTPQIEQIMGDAITKMMEDKNADLPAVLKGMQAQVEAALKQ